MSKKVNEMTEIAETNETGFGDLELKISKPTLNSDKSLSITGNFTELGAKIQGVVDKYKNTVLTEDNVSYVKTLKGQFVSLRTGIERERKEYKKVYIEPASKIIDSMCKELLQIVDEGESALGKQLEEYDEKRKAELTLVLMDYVDDSSARHNLREEYKNQIVLLDKYYNKTQHEEDSADDIERQAVELEKKQKEYDSGVELIKAECADADFLPDSYIRELQYKSAMEIILEIKADKKTSMEIKEKENKGEKVVIGEEIDAELKKSFEKAGEDLTRTRILRVTYKASQASIMAKFFKENDISFEFIKTDF